MGLRALRLGMRGHWASSTNLSLGSPRCQAELDNLRSSTHLTHCWAPRKEGKEGRKEGAHSHPRLMGN